MWLSSSFQDDTSVSGHRPNSGGCLRAVLQKGSPWASVNTHADDGDRFVFFRFASALLLIVLISMAGVMLEKQTLDLRRLISRQYYQTDLLVEHHVRLRLEIQNLTSPTHLTQMLPSENTEPPKQTVNSEARSRRRDASQTKLKKPTVSDPEKELQKGTTLPLLRFQQPVNSAGID